MKTAGRFLTLISLCTAITEPSLAGDGVTGAWLMDNGKVSVRIAPCGEEFCGTIFAMKKPLDKHGNPKIDRKNPDPAKRTRSVIGITVLSNMRPDGEGNWIGKIYNADDGHTYNSYLRINGDTMKVKACVAIICKSIMFNRLD